MLLIESIKIRYYWLHEREKADCQNLGSQLDSINTSYALEVITHQASVWINHKIYSINPREMKLYTHSSPYDSIHSSVFVSLWLFLSFRSR